MQAITWLRACRHVDENLAFLQRSLGKHGVPAGPIEGLVARALDEQRLCQTVTADIDALEPALALKAYNEGARGAAFALVRAAGYAAPAQPPSDLVQRLRHDAEGGHEDTLEYLHVSGWQWQVPDLERHAYGLVIAELERRRSSGRHSGESPVEPPVLDVFPWTRPSLSEDEKQQAQAAAAAILARCCEPAPDRKP